MHLSCVKDEHIWSIHRQSCCAVLPCIVHLSWISLLYMKLVWKETLKGINKLLTILNIQWPLLGDDASMRNWAMEHQEYHAFWYFTSCTTYFHWLHPQAFQGRVLMAAQTPAVQKMHQEPVNLYLFHYGGMHFSICPQIMHLLFLLCYGSQLLRICPQIMHLRH